MSFDDFKASLTAGETPPAGIIPALTALWWQGKGQWEQAHAAAQSGRDAASAWVHAHLHRVEGDLSNAAYWYSRAGRPVDDSPLDAEWRAIVTALLDG